MVNQCRPLSNLSDGPLTALSVTTFQSLRPRSFSCHLFGGALLSSAVIGKPNAPLWQVQFHNPPHTHPLFCWDTCLLLPQTLPAATRNGVSWSRVPNCWCVPSCNFSLSTFPFTRCLVFCLPSSLLLLPHPGPPFFSSSPTFHNLRLATLSS